MVLAKTSAWARALAASLAISIWSVPAFAQDDVQPMPEPAEDYTSMSIQEIGAHLGNLDGMDDCTQAAPLLAEAFARRPDITELAIPMHSAFMRCAIDRNDYAEALTHFESWEAAGQSLPVLGLVLATYAENGAETARRLEGILQSGDPEVLQLLNDDNVFPALRAASADGLDAELSRISAWAIQDGVLDQLDPTLHTAFASRALSVAVAEENREFARELLGYIQSPTTHIGLLASREFEPIWPAIEERVGPNLDSVTSAYRASTIEAWTENPENPELLNDISYGLYWHGDYEGLIETVGIATGRENLATTMVEDEAWALNLLAYSYDALDRPDEADAVFDLIGLAPEGTENEVWRVSFTINRGSRLVGQGRWEEGLAAAELAGSIAQGNGTPFARAITLRDRICALDALERTGETAELLERLREEAADYPHLLAPALLCLGMEDEAVELLIAGLESEDTRDNLIVELQPEAFEMFYTRSILPHPRDLLATRSELREVFLRYARIVPDAFVPAASLSR